MEDLTIIFLTVNKLPKQWAKYHREVLVEAAGNYPIISISREPMNFGTNLIQTEDQSSFNLYWQLYRGAKEAKTPYIALVEDDTLYHRDHFTFFRPPMDTFAYDMNRWSLFTWGEPTYSFKMRIAGCAGIYPRELAIEALEERFAKWPNGIPHELNGELGFAKFEKRMNVSVRKSVHVFSSTSVIQFHHTFGIQGSSRKIGPNDTADLIARMKRKRMGLIRAFDIPHWGKSEELAKHFI